MKRGTLVALGVGVLALSLLAYYLYRRKNTNPSMSNFGGLVPSYVPGGSFVGPPLPAANKLGQTFQNINSAVQSGEDLAFTGKNVWDSIKSTFS